MKIPEISFDELKKMLDGSGAKRPVPAIFGGVAKVTADPEFESGVTRHLALERHRPLTALGIDIYHYSDYPAEQQALIPFVFKLLYEEAVRLCVAQDQYVFQGHIGKRGLEEYFISTGDGGFQIFETPIHAIVFAINFAVMLRAYNAFKFHPQLRDFVGEINLRYAITTDTLFRFDRNFYGTAIINNARILGKDSLNRLLIDENTHNWFMININGVENLQTLELADLAMLGDFARYDRAYMKAPHENGTFVKKYCEVTAADILKIGTILAKNTKLSIYNLHIQSKQLVDTRAKKPRYMTISLGNLNISGI